MRWFSFTLLLFLTSTLSHAGTLYKSVDANGKVIYSDKPPENGKIEKTFDFANLPATPLPDSVLRYREELSKSMKNRLADAARPNAAQITLFSADWCGYCTQPKAYLAEKKIAYKEHNIDTPDGMQAMAQAGLKGGIPVLVRSGRNVQGFSRPAYDALFAAP